MPYVTEQRPAELFMEHAGVRIYHVYKENEFDQGVRTYWYAIHDDGNDDNAHAVDGVFDVRCLPSPASGPRLDDQPPFIGFDQGRAAGFATFNEWKNSPEFARRKALWDQWHQTGESEAISKTIRHAIDLGLITAEHVSDSDSGGNAA